LVEISLFFKFGGSIHIVQTTGFSLPTFVKKYKRENEKSIGQYKSLRLIKIHISRLFLKRHNRNYGKIFKGEGDAHQYILSIGKSIIIKQARLIVARLPSIKKD